MLPAKPVQGLPGQVQPSENTLRPFGSAINRVHSAECSARRWARPVVQDHEAPVRPGEGGGAAPALGDAVLDDALLGEGLAVRVEELPDEVAGAVGVAFLGGGPGEEDLALVVGGCLLYTSPSPRD